MEINYIKYLGGFSYDLFTVGRIYKRKYGNFWEYDSTDTDLLNSHQAKLGFKEAGFEICTEAEYLAQFKESLPEYYECVKTSCSFTKGKIYKIINPNNLEDVYNFLDNKGVQNGYAGNNHENFKPSTKEAFDLQNKSKDVMNKPNFEVGKWYNIRYNYSNSNYNLVFKVNKCDHDSVYFDNRQYYSNTDKGWYNFFDKISFKDLNNLIYDQLSLEEIQQYLPDGHVDKIKNNSLTIDGEYYSVTYPSQGMYIFIASGDNRIVRSINNTTKYFSVSSNMSTSNGFIDYKLATKEEKQWLESCIKANKFISKEEALKETEMDITGRYLKALVVNPYGGSSINVNDYGIIVTDNNHNLYVNFPSVNKYLIFKNQLTEGRVELMPVGFKPAISGCNPMTKEELLEEARLRYKNCKTFKSIIPNGLGIPILFKGVGKFVKNYSDDKDIIWNGGSPNRIGWLYYDGKWADIIEYNSITQGEGYYSQIIEEESLKNVQVLKHPKDDLEFQNPVIVKKNKNKKFKLVTINQ